VHNGLRQSAHQNVEDASSEHQKIMSEKTVQPDDSQDDGSEGLDDGKDEKPRCQPLFNCQILTDGMQSGASDVL
jgi:hypothetical protein